MICINSRHSLVKHTFVNCNQVYVMFKTLRYQKHWVSHQTLNSSRFEKSALMSKTWVDLFSKITYNKKFHRSNLKALFKNALTNHWAIINNADISSFSKMIQELISYFLIFVNLFDLHRSKQHFFDIFVYNHNSMNREHEREFFCI